ncbi:Lrp/AsnC family transcriptional regulator [Chloroflexota bacterium]
MDKVTRILSAHPGVSHGYERDHRFNLWFTLAIPPTTDLETELQRLTSYVKAEVIFALPALKLFKIGAYFDMAMDYQSIADTIDHPSDVLPQKVRLSQMDRSIINELQQDLPLVSQPFTAMSDRLGMNMADFLARCQSLKQRGIMRRFGAAVNHKQAGFKANAMVCWVSPLDIVDVVGRKIASLREVSHCYERRTNPLWQYNLFAVIHGHTREACQEVARKTSNETGIDDYILLFSTREFKKARIKYQV